MYLIDVSRAIDQTLKKTIVNQACLLLIIKKPSKYTFCPKCLFQNGKTVLTDYLPKIIK
ncbi:hypothetical protein IMCC3317_05190 [Kordia antarctica]|uniref:Uncharacterized protein n=1 Tax=Kordia antarctica TaxID=1218801 RepID=A0A7L4ZER4_9FLAO|nr:hypothetical protein IMCC3317_05190 [Kordia antarctica]